MSNGNEPAFPFVSHGGVTEHQYCQGGMTFRQWLAGLAMQGMSAYECNTQPSQLAFMAVRAADALIAELEKNKDE